jgi:hypothetical protein
MNSFTDGSSRLASSSASSSSASSSASSSDNPTEGHFVPGKASDTITPANTNIVLDEVMQSMAGGQIDQSSSATPQVSKAGVSSVAIPTPHQPFKATSLQTGASGKPFSRRINDIGTLITTTPLKRVISGVPKDGDPSPKKPKQGDHEEDHQDDGGEQSIDALPSAQPALHRKETDRDWTSLSRVWNESLKSKFPDGRKSVPFEVKIAGKENKVGKINWGSFMTSFNV